MKPPLPRILSAVPRTPHVQLEVAKAIRTIAGPDEDELLRQRQAELTAIRHDLDALARDVCKVGKEARALLRVELQKYSPDQSRVPAGSRDGGSGPAGVRRGAKHLERQYAMPRWKSRLAARGLTWQLAAGLLLIRTRQIPKMS